MQMLLGILQWYKINLSSNHLTGTVPDTLFSGSPEASCFYASALVCLVVPDYIDLANGITSFARLCALSTQVKPGGCYCLQCCLNRTSSVVCWACASQHAFTCVHKQIILHCVLLCRRPSFPVLQLFSLDMSNNDLSGTLPSSQGSLTQASYICQTCKGLCIA